MFHCSTFIISSVYELWRMHLSFFIMNNVICVTYFSLWIMWYVLHIFHYVSWIFSQCKCIFSFVLLMAENQINDIEKHFTNTINTLKHINIQPIQHTHVDKIKKPSLKGLLLIKQRSEKTHNNIVNLINDLEKTHKKLLSEFKQIGK